ncbi:HEAT repeat domain-containing protein [Catenulispora yoronensis]
MGGYPAPTPQRRAENRVRADRPRLVVADAELVGKLIADLGHPDEETRLYATYALAWTRSAAAVEPLVAAWERLRASDDPENAKWEIGSVRRALSRSLAADTHLALALRLTDHEDPGVRWTAVEFLRTVDDPAARAAAVRHELQVLHPYLGLADTDPALTRPEAIGRLVELLTGKPDNLRVIEAMERIGDRTCLSALTKSLGWKVAGSVQTRADEAIRAIGGTDALGRAALAVVRDPEADPTRAAYLVGQLGLTEAIPDLLAILRKGRAGWSTAAAVLAAFGVVEAAPRIGEILGRILHQSSKIQSPLIRYLIRLGPEPAVDVLITAARTSRDKERDLAMDALARCTDPRAVELVVSAIFHDVIRMALVRPLAERGDPRVVDALIHVVNTSKDRRIREVATRGIQRAAQVDQQAVDDLMQRFHYGRGPRTAVAWLEGHRATPRTGQYPLSALSQACKDLDERVRAQAVKSLALIGTPRAFNLLRTLEDDPSRHVRACVAGALLAEAAAESGAGAGAGPESGAESAG